jgi:SOS-response transcriptional repressor LexA
MIMMPDEIAAQWLKTAYKGWLHKCGNTSHLREPMQQVVEQMHEAVDRSDFVSAAHYLDRIRDLSERFSIPQTGSLKLHTYETAESRMECGLAAYHMGDKVEAMKLFLEAASKYTGNDHCKAVITWMLGCIQWQLSTRINDAIISWESSYELFKNLEEPSKRIEYAQWYRWWYTVMRLTFDKAIAGSFVSPPPEKDWPDDVEHIIFADNSKGREKGTSAPFSSSVVSPPWTSEVGVLRSYPVFASIPAGGFGSMPTSSDIRLETERIMIGHVPHYVVNLHGGKAIDLKINQHYVAVRVQGESLNLNNIKDGDYVLLQVQEDATNGDIAAVMVLSDMPEDEKFSLKHFRRKDGKIILSPNSSNPKYKPYEFWEDDKKVVVQGVALAVLKRIPEET